MVNFLKLVSLLDVWPFCFPARKKEGPKFNRSNRGHYITNPHNALLKRFPNVLIMLIKTCRLAPSIATFRSQQVRRIDEGFILHQLTHRKKKLLYFE